MIIPASISMTTSDDPKIKPTAVGAQVMFDLYGVSVDELLKLTNAELVLEIKKK